jgi:putative spermidine/putrescine transport system ATP-binding protein
MPGEISKARGFDLALQKVMPMTLPLVRLSRLRKSFDGGRPVVRDLSLEIAPGEVVTLLGPSGSGKTTTLMLLAGFERPDAGDIEIEGRPMVGVPPYRRGIGVVLQTCALFPHMTVAQNVAFPLSVRGLSRGEQGERIGRMFAMLRLGGLEERLPAQLSTGQRQFVALARALVFQPRLVLLDDPLGTLDRPLREQMQHAIHDLQQRLGVTMLCATRDQAEALTLSDRVAVLADGRVQQVGTPQELYEHPVNAFVAGCIGENNCLPGSVEAIEDDIARVRLAAGPIVEALVVDVAEGERCVVSVRPERVAVAAVTAEEMGEGAVAAELRQVVYVGDHVRLRLQIGLRGADPAEVVVKRPAGAPLAGLAPGEPVALAWAPHHARAFRPEE